MAEVRWPKNNEFRRGRFAHLQGIPYLVCDDGEYPEGINAYLHERVRGSIPALMGGERPLVPQRLGQSSAKQIAFNVCDIVKWAETAEAHPSLGRIAWHGLKSWHVTDLYQDALNLGFWTEAFFKDGHPFPLDPDTVRTRIGEALRCFVWMEKQGYVDRFGHEPSQTTVRLSQDSALLSYRGEMVERVKDDIPVRSRRIRQSPGDFPLPSLDHLTEFFALLPKGAIRLAVMEMFETGMRADEVVNNSLIPGRLHDRSEQPVEHSAWPTRAYQLEYSLKDDRMIGVIPTEKMGWEETARVGYQCALRIIGKGPQIRQVNLPPAFVKKMWAFIEGSRIQIERDNIPRGVASNAYAYINRFGKKLQYHSIWEACDVVNKKLKAPINLTPHSFRHAYACYFLEVGLRERAKERRVDPENIPLAVIQEEGPLLLLVIKGELGHKEFKTTEQYLAQIIKGRIGLSYHETWNRFLDSTQFDADE